MLAALDETERSERVDLQGQDPRSPLLIPCVALTLSKREPVTGGSSGMLLLRRLEQGPGNQGSLAQGPGLCCLLSRAPELVSMGPASTADDRDDGVDVKRPGEKTTRS